MARRDCSFCHTPFEVSAGDIAFLNKMSPVVGDEIVPISQPSRCPACRQQRRWARRNQSTLYHRKCDSSGKDIISLYSPEGPYLVYEEDIWWSDAWDPFDFARDFDFSKPFFEQFYELQLAVPRRAMERDGNAENCTYSTYGVSNKDCYLLFGGALSESVHYSTWLVKSRDCLDSLLCTNSELIYESVDSQHCFNAAFLKDCSQCTDSYFLEDCRNCKHCICCKNLQNKEYHVYNQPVSQEDFKELQQRILSETLEVEAHEFEKWKRSQPGRATHMVACENCSGDYLERASNCYECFDVLLTAQDLKYCRLAGWSSSDMLDCCAAGKNSELLYEAHATAECYKCAFCSGTRYSQQCYYCENVSSSRNCFGCIGLGHAEFCILNKQYSEEEYNTLLPQIITHMTECLDWGEFFPMEHSPFSYNETLAQEYFPLSEEQALSFDLQWVREKAQDFQPASYEPSGSITEVMDDVTHEVLACSNCERNYRIIAQELVFYRKTGLPLPRRCPQCRHLRRMKSRHSGKLWEQECSKCGEATLTAVDPHERELIYCEPCYQSEFY